MLRRNDPDFQAGFDDCFRRASYFVKVNQKGSPPYGRREVPGSKRSATKAE